MRNIPIAILLIILPVVCLAEWPSIDFHTDGTIQDGNTFLSVQVFDNATVNMTGGLIGIGGLQLNDTSIFNAYGGNWSGQFACYFGFRRQATFNLYYLQLPEWHRIWTEGDSS